MNHYITKYSDCKTGKKYAVSWLQISILGWTWCLWKKEIEI